MNLNESPSLQQLQAILASLDDNTAHHIVWVGHDGEVHVDPLPSDLTPSGFETRNKDSIRFRLETLQRGTGHVGSTATEDHEWTSRLFNALIGFWKKGVVGYQEYF